MLVDTSVWVDHLRHGNAALAARLETGQVESHPFVIGELACGHLRRRAEVLSLLNALPKVRQVEHEDALALLESRHLMGRGLGWVDVHIIASALVSKTSLWTLDKRLSAIAREAGVPFE